ncbi:uncharacterized protein [Solanum lycopersicum]|uniref:uncharacterized protein n=1 Tax=Solanum lycopersicum TaxID=4081 RepID=UPI003748E2EB
MSVYYHPGKANVVADALSRLYMGSVAHVDEKNDLVKDVHRLARLGVFLMSISYSGVTVQHGAESSSVVEVKEKQESDPILLELKGSLFVEWHEEGYNEHCEQVPQLPASQGRTSETKRMTKSFWFLAVKTTYSVEDYANLYLTESVRFHGTNGQAKRTIQNLEDTLRTCVIDLKGEAALIGPDSVLYDMEKVQLLRYRLKTAQSRHKSYADVRRRELEFKVDDWIFLKVSPMTGVMRFGKKGKFSPRYVGPYKILKRIGKVAYELELPAKLEAVHSIFDISLLKK